MFTVVKGLPLYAHLLQCHLPDEAIEAHVFMEVKQINRSSNVGRDDDSKDQEQHQWAFELGKQEPKGRHLLPGFARIRPDLLQPLLWSWSAA